MRKLVADCSAQSGRICGMAAVPSAVTDGAVRAVVALVAPRRSAHISTCDYRLISQSMTNGLKRGRVCGILEHATVKQQPAAMLKERSFAAGLANGSYRP